MSSQAWVDTHDSTGMRHTIGMVHTNEYCYYKKNRPYGHRWLTECVIEIEDWAVLQEGRKIGRERRIGALPQTRRE